MTGRAHGRAKRLAHSQAPPPSRPQPMDAGRRTPADSGHLQSRHPSADPRPPSDEPGPSWASSRASLSSGAVSSFGEGPARPGPREPPHSANGKAAGGRPSRSTGDEPPQKRSREAFVSRYQEPLTKPSHIQDTKGVTGTPIPLLTNYFVLHTRPNSAIYQYHVDFSPPVDSKALRKKLLRDHEELVGKVRAFDGMVLFLPHRLPNPETELVSKLKEGDEVHIKIKLTNELQPDNPTCLQLINILFRRVQEKLEMQEIGRHYYNPKLSTAVPQHKVEIWPGFITSILPYERHVMLCAEISHKILRTITVLEMMYEIHQSARRDFHAEATRKLVGAIVMTRYNNKTYRVDDIDWEKNPQSTFSTRNGEVSFVQYYENAYNKKIADMEQPLLVSMPKKRDQRRGMDGPILLIPELCHMTGLTDEMRSDFRVMKDLAVHTRVGPSQRVDTLNRFMQDMGRNAGAQEILQGWNLQFDSKPACFDARGLPPEKLYQAQKSYSYSPQDSDWTREMRGAPLMQPVNLQNYLVVFTHSDGQKVNDFVRTLDRVGGPMGIRLGRPQMCELPDDRTDTFLRALRQNIHPRLQLAICVLPRNTKDRYDAIKKLCCLEKPVPSQCVQSRTIGNPKSIMSVTTKIALQLNCKLGGELWALEIPMKNCMVIGIDSYHDSSQKGRSVLGFIASTNATFTRYFCQCVFQSAGEEMATNLNVCMTAALRKYHHLHNCFPDRIFVYRDGVGEGQVQHVYDFEVAQFLECFQKQSGYKPKFTFSIVTKKISTRFFAKIRGQLLNPPPGTVVDKEVTKKGWYDFFIVSQCVRQGTVGPTHYNVISDSSGLKPDHLQRLTYKLCHLYYNWPGTIRVPAPCQYAHKLAFLVGQSIHREPSQELADRLYFL